MKINPKTSWSPYVDEDDPATWNWPDEAEDEIDPDGAELDEQERDNDWIRQGA